MKLFQIVQFRGCFRSKKWKNLEEEFYSDLSFSYLVNVWKKSVWEKSEDENEIDS